MTNEEAKVFLDNLKICINEHPIVADWLVEIANRKTEPQTIRCPKCGRSDYIREFGKDFSVTAEESGFKYKCINCNTYIEPQSDLKTEPTISKMEQVEQRSCDTCKNRDIEGWKNPCLGCTGFAFYEPKDEPRTCSVNGRPYSECSSCERFRCTADEPQTDCPWK